MRRRWQPRPSLLMGNQGGKATKWLPAHFHFYGSAATNGSAGRGTGASIYLPPLSENSLIFCLSPFAKSPPVFLPEQTGRKKHRPPFPPSAAPTGITHYTLQAKSCAKGQAPLETPDNKTGWISRTFPVPDIQPLFVVSSPFHGLPFVSLSIMFPYRSQLANSFFRSGSCPLRWRFRFFRFLFPQAFLGIPDDWNFALYTHHQWSAGYLQIHFYGRILRDTAFETRFVKGTFCKM